MLSKLKSSAYKLPSGNPWPWIAPSCPLLWSVGWTCCLAFHKQNRVGQTGCPSWDWVMKRPETFNVSLPLLALSPEGSQALWYEETWWGTKLSLPPWEPSCFPSGRSPFGVLTTSKILKSEVQSKLYYWLLSGGNAKKTFVVLSFWIRVLFLNWHRITKTRYS